MFELVLTISGVVLFWGVLKKIAKALEKNIENLGKFTLSHTSALAKSIPANTDIQIHNALTRAGYDSSKLTIAQGSIILSNIKLAEAVERAGYNPDDMQVHEMMQVLETISELDMAATEEEVLTVLKKLSNFSKYKKCKHNA